MKNHHFEATNLLLASMFRLRHPDRRRHSFIFNKPGTPMFSGGGDAEVNYDNQLLLQAALYLRKTGSPHLRSLSIGKLESILTGFLSDHYYLIANETWLSSFEGSYANQLSASAKSALTAALAVSSMFVEPCEITLFPLIPITVESGFNATPFFIGAPADLVSQLACDDISRTLVPDSFPPMSDWEYRRETPRAWLGVRAPTLDAARQMRAAILGAVALLPHHMERYTFSGRQMFGGYTTLAGGWSMAFGEPHTPALMTDLVIVAADHAWLSVLAEKISSPRKDDKRQLRALEYYYGAWAPDPVTRFPTLFAALDAIYGDAGKATQAIVDAIGPVMGPDYTSERIRLMLGLRASVIHGGAPNVYESSKYEDYYKTYLKDATRDLELIVARCLQTVIFPGVMIERAHNHADIILRETGRTV